MTPAPAIPPLHPPGHTRSLFGGPERVHPRPAAASPESGADGGARVTTFARVPPSQPASQPPSQPPAAPPPHRASLAQLAGQITQARGALLLDPATGDWLSNLDPARSAFGLSASAAQALIAAGIACRRGETLVLVSQGDR